MHFRSNHSVKEFINSRATGAMRQMRLIVYLVVSIMAIVGMPFHFVFNWIGYNDVVLHAFSFFTWAAVIIALGLYLKRKLTLETAFLIAVTSFQLITSIRIVYISATTTPELITVNRDLILVNVVVSFVDFINTCLGMLRNGPTIVLGIFWTAMAMAFIICPEVVASQFVIMFGLATFFLWIYSVAMRIFIYNMSHEADDYKKVEDSILDLLKMSKVEITSLVQLCRQAKSTHDLDEKLAGHLSAQTRHNIIELSEYLSNEKREKHINLSELLPQLTPTETEVCRMVLRGLSLKEIAIALGKSTNNIGTVRGNIRKKLQLRAGEELRTSLMNALDGTPAARPCPAVSGRSKE